MPCERHTAFFFSENVAQLIEIARSETNPELRRDAVQWLGRSESDEALEFLMSLLEE